MKELKQERSLANREAYNRMNFLYQVVLPPSFVNCILADFAISHVYSKVWKLHARNSLNLMVYVQKTSILRSRYLGHGVSLSDCRFVMSR